MYNENDIINKLRELLERQPAAFQKGRALNGGVGKQITVNINGKKIKALSYNVISPNEVTVFYDSTHDRYIAWQQPNRVLRSDKLIYRRTKPTPIKRTFGKYLFKVFTRVVNSLLKVQGFGSEVEIENSDGYELVGLTNTGDGYVAIAKSGNTYLFDVDATQTTLTVTTSNFSNNVIPDFQWQGHDLLIEGVTVVEKDDPRFDAANIDISTNTFSLTPSYNATWYASEPAYNYTNSVIWTFTAVSNAQLTIATGSISFPYTDSPFSVQSGYVIKVEANSGNYMIGTVTSASSSFIYMVVSEIVGTGTFDTWGIYKNNGATTIHRDQSMRAYSCTLNECFLELYFLLPYRQNNLPDVFSTSTNWINIDFPLSYWDVSEDFSNQTNIVWQSEKDDVNTSITINTNNVKTANNIQISSYTYTPTGQVITTYIDKSTTRNLTKSVTRTDNITIPYEKNIIELTGLKTSSGNIVMGSSVTMNRTSQNARQGSHTPHTGSGSTMPVYTENSITWNESLSIVDGTSSLSLTDCFLDITDFQLPITYESFVSLNNDSTSNGVTRNINIDQTFSNSKTYNVPSVILKSTNCLITENVNLELQFENKILTTNWDGYTNTGLVYRRKKKHCSPPKQDYKLFITNTDNPISFDKVGSNIIVETNNSVLTDIENNVATITLINPDVEIGNVSLFVHLVDSYPSETTITLTNPNYFVVQTLGGSIYDSPMIPITDSIFSQRIFSNYNVGSNVVALHCFRPMLDIADYVSELYFTVEGTSGFDTQFSVLPHTRRQHGGKTISTHRPSYPDNRRTLSQGSDPTVTLDGLPMLYNFTVTNVEYTENELTKQRGIDVTDVEVYVISNNVTKRYDATLTDYVWDTEEDYCDIPDYLWFCGQKKINLSSVTLNIDYETETTLDYYCWSTVYDNTVIIVTKDNHTTSVINYIKNDNKNVNMYVENDVVRIAIANIPQQTDTTAYADIYEFDTVNKKFIRIGNDSSDLSAIDDTSNYISYHP